MIVRVRHERAWTLSIGRYIIANMRMDVTAYWGTAIVHAAALTAVALPGHSWMLGAAPRLLPVSGSVFNVGEVSSLGWPDRSAGEARHLFVAAELRKRPSVHSSGPVLQAPHHDCPTSPPVDRAAIRLATESSGHRLSWPDDTRDNVEICARITAAGGVETAYVAEGRRGDERRLLREVRRLSFSPAQRANRPVAAWHRLIVYRSKDSEAHAIH